MTVINRISSKPRRILFVFAWLVVGGEETEIRLLAEHLDPNRYCIDVVACFRKPNMPDQTHEQLRVLGIQVDQTPYQLSFEETVAYLADKMTAYDLIVACQAVPDVYPALERMAVRPPLIEHGGLVQEAERGPKYLTSRYVGVCETIRAAAAEQMLDRPHHALEIQSMVDLRAFDASQRGSVRLAWGISDERPIVGWVGRLDRKKRVEDFIAAAAQVHKVHPEALFIIIGGPDAFMPEYAESLYAQAYDLGLSNALRFLGDCPNVPHLMMGLDIFVWLSEGEGMPHVISEAGAAGLPVIATCDNGTAEQITHEESGLFVPHRDPGSAAFAICRLIDDPLLRQKLGQGLYQKVKEDYSIDVIVPRWMALFDEVIQECS